MLSRHLLLSYPGGGGKRMKKKTRRGDKLCGLLLCFTLLIIASLQPKHIEAAEMKKTEAAATVSHGSSVASKSTEAAAQSASTAEPDASQAAVVSSSDSAAAQPVRVAWYEDSYHITGANGNRSGYGYEYEQAVSAYTGWNYDYVSGSWEDLLAELQAGEIDLMGNLSYTDERAKTMLFSDEPMAEEKYYLYADLSHSDISPTDLSSLNGQSIAMMKSSVQTTQFTEWEQKHGIETKHVYVESIDEAKALLEKHAIQGVISSETSIWVEDGLSAIYTVGGSETYFAISKSRPDLKKALDTAMCAMESDKPFYKDDLYQRYIATQSLAVLSTAEENWLQQHGKLRIGYLSKDVGFSTMNSATGQLVGVINDYIEAASHGFSQAIAFEPVGYESQEALIQAVQDGDIDLIFHVNQNPYYAEQSGLSLSNTVLTVPLAVVTRQDAFDENAEHTVAIAKDNTNYSWYVAYNYPNWKILECDSRAAAEKMVAEGRADCFIASSAQVMNYVNDRQMHCVFLTCTANACFAVRKGEVTLMSILNKTLKMIQTSKLTGAVSMYEDSLRKVTVMDFVRDNVGTVSVLVLSIFVLILCIGITLVEKARRAEARAKVAQAAAEQANAAKTSFLFNMSHDIRTPMNALLGYTQLMKKETTDPKLLHYQEKMEQSGQLLLSIINNILDMARIESGKMELDESASDVGMILDEVRGVFEPSAQEKKLHFRCENAVEHRMIVCDHTKIEQIFVNLVSNAIKYTPEGGSVLIRAEEIPCADPGRVRIRTIVQDNGIGMSEEYLPKLFDTFTRERNTTIGRVPGTGLGMAIVKQLVEKMGGSIEVESALGKGTTFTLVLEHRMAEPQANRTGATASSDERRARLRGRHILLAEDNDLNAEIAMTILEEMGLRVDRVADGIECVSRMEQMPAGTYELILMDVQMPKMDGYKATQVIRHLEDREKATIPIIAMTANAFEEDRKMALSQGMNGHIAKPIDLEKLEALLYTFLKG
ncbi:MAG TPA: hypothetical protein DD632_07285 [Oribacterium sp.]|nr:hypothetical protein [Oribacterium sp.]